MKSGTLNLFIASTILFFIIGCSDASWDVDEQYLVTEELQSSYKRSEKKNEKCSICHYQKQQNAYMKLNISCGNPLDAHLRHGDGEVGGPVPNMEGFVFGENCEFLENVVVVPCPCFKVEDFIGFEDLWTDYCVNESIVDINGNGIEALQDLENFLCACVAPPTGNLPEELFVENLSPEQSTACVLVLQQLIEIAQEYSDENNGDFHFNENCPG